MRITDGSQLKLAVCLAIGLGAFWLAAPPTSTPISSAFGGWLPSGTWPGNIVVAMTTSRGDMHYFSEIVTQSCEWWYGGSTNCWGGWVEVGVPSYLGQEQKNGETVDCYGGCDWVRDADT
jgi:hypothetical protein